MIDSIIEDLLRKEDISLLLINNSTKFGFFG